MFANITWVEGVLVAGVAVTIVVVIVCAYILAEDLHKNKMRRKAKAPCRHGSKRDREQCAERRKAQAQAQAQAPQPPASSSSGMAINQRGSGSGGGDDVEYPDDSSVNASSDDRYASGANSFVGADDAAYIAKTQHDAVFAGANQDYGNDPAGYVDRRDDNKVTNRYGEGAPRASFSSWAQPALNLEKPPAWQAANPRVSSGLAVATEQEVLAHESSRERLKMMEENRAREMRHPLAQTPTEDRAPAYIQYYTPDHTRRTIQGATW